MIRRILALWVAMSMAVLAQAQMSVKAFRLLERDLTAITEGTKRISKQDGNVAALIKVVNTETGFSFDGGSYSLVGNPEYHTGEIWVYVPARAQKISISHSRFGVLRDYYYPVPIEAGRTYEMQLDLGVGRYVTIQTQTPLSTIHLDGDSIGTAPIFNMYMLYGHHTLKATNDKMEGTLDIDIKKDSTDQSEVFTIPMADQSVHFGRVSITTDKDAEIVLNGTVKGVGTWHGELREGSYVVETRRVNCDTEKTSFTVKAQTDNNITAKAPTPHKGYLQIFTRPANISLAINGKPAVKTERMELPVGIQTLAFSHKGYHSVEREYNIRHNVTIADTLNLRRIQYLKPDGFYFGGSYVVGQFSGVAGHIGGTLRNIDAQFGYMFGLTKSNAVNFYNPNDGSFLCKCDYTLNSFSAKIGYQFALATKFGIVPQVGVAAQSLRCNLLDGTDGKGDGAACTCLTAGSKLIYSPVQHFCLYVAPEYDAAMSKDKMFDTVANAAGFSAGGFECHIGLMANF